MILWTSQDAISATGGTCTTDWVANGISIDTRSIEKGDLFVALQDQRDGHDFVAQALANGASAALVSHIPADVPDDAPLLIVDDVLIALGSMAKFARNRTNAKVIGVTGSVGKTSTKEMLRTALSTQGNVHAAERSFNNHWGVPLTLARMPVNTDYAVIEIGMNHPEEIRPLAKMAQLDVAVITTVAAVHMEAFDSVDDIADAKAEIFDGLRSNGAAVINCDIATFGILKNAVGDKKLITFGRNQGPDYGMGKITSVGCITSVMAQIDGKPALFKFQAAGEHFAMNALAVLAAAVSAGADLDKTMLAMGDWTAPDGRGARHVVDLGDGKEIELIDESYNANPSSMASALAVLADSQTSGRRIAILGEMGELGETELQRHAELADLDTVAQVDQFHLVGPMMQAMYDMLPMDKRGLWVATADELVAKIKTLLTAGDIVMVKGSNYTQVSKVVDAIKKIGA